MENYERYRAALNSNASATVNSFLDTRWDEIANVVKGLSSKKVDLTQITTTATEDFGIKLVHGFAAIDNSLGCLLDTQAYLSSFKPGDNRVRHLYLCVESYINETGLLRQRIQDYLKCIPRLYRRDNLYQKILGATSAVSVNVDKLFDDILKIEEKYILGHHYRDEELDMLMAYDAYPVEKASAFVAHCEASYNRVLGRWQQDVENSNRRVEKCLDECFAILLDTIFDDQLRIVYPQRL